MPDGKVVCTKKRCPKPKVGCAHGGKVYNQGETFMIDCNTCICRLDGNMVCTQIECEHDGQESQEDDGQESQEDDGQESQEDDGQESQEDDGQQSQEDDGQQRQEDEGQQRQGIYIPGYT